ncbi:MAG: hypothetical protein AB7V13_18345 [Pseudorhodoplanes sp.]|uniref:hypothetical protein n=1 Tax=Pseudorhodoplanes sp. TaxID=1934341 RepID=UPI003D0F4285
MSILILHAYDAAGAGLFSAWDAASALGAEPPPTQLPHPDDVLIDEKGVRIVGPTDEEGLRKFETVSRCRDAYVAGGPGRTFDSASFGFFIRDLTEIDNPERVFPITAEEINRINPNSGTAPIFRSGRDKEITSGIYARLPVLVGREFGDAVWPVRYVRILDMAMARSSSVAWAPAFTPCFFLL